MLGVVFLLIVVFLPGGIMEGLRRILGLFKRRPSRARRMSATQPQPAE
jgi:hypothetical protein